MCVLIQINSACYVDAHSQVITYHRGCCPSVVSLIEDIGARRGNVNATIYANIDWFSANMQSTRAYPGADLVIGYLTLIYLSSPYNEKKMIIPMFGLY